MSKLNQGIVGKPSKASLKSRGLSTSNSLRRGQNFKISDGYSLYSTDSEDNIVPGVNRGLDKCAELLTNILEIKSDGEDMKKSVHHLQRKTSLKNKKEKYAPSSKFGPTKSDVRKLKPKTVIHIPTGGTQNTGHGNSKKVKTAYNEKVVASTPVLSAEQRKQLQELQKRENSLKQQIEQLQDEYDNIEKQGVMETSPQMAEQSLTEDNNSELQETKSSRRSLDFCHSAEKPFVDNPQVQGNAGIKENSKDTTKKRTNGDPEKSRKVQFASKACELQVTQNNNSYGSPPRENKREEGSAGESRKDGQKESSKVCKKFRSPQRYSDHLRILAYLVGELRAVLASSGEKEVERLLNDIEAEIRLLTSMYSPQQSPRTMKQHDIDTEIALQPLRSENSDLRRKLRIANQRTRDMEEQLQKAEANRNEHPAEEGVIEHLHKQLFLESENVKQLKRRNEQAEKEIAQRNKENSNLQDILAGKDEELESLNEDLRRQKRITNTEVSFHSQRQLEAMEITIRTKNKEVDMLKLAIEQRDSEIERLSELTRGLQQSLTRVLTNVQDLHPDDVLSDMSIISGLESWKPTNKQNIIPSMFSTAARVHSPQSQASVAHNCDEELDVRTLVTSNREYDNVALSVPGTQYRRQSVSSVSDWDTTLSVSSADEFVFKQELANLDTIIARLQNSLRKK